jgi:hypothetical protein
MPDSVIKKVKSLGRHTQQNTFDFVDRNGILFDWDDKVDEQQEGLVEEDLIPYQSLAAEIPGVTLDRDTPAIEDKIVPQGHAEDVAAWNADLAPLVISAGVDGPVPVIVTTHNDEIKYNDNDGDIIAVADID